MEHADSIHQWIQLMVCWACFITNEIRWKLDGARWQYSSMDSIDGMLSMFYNKWDYYD